MEERDGSQAVKTRGFGDQQKGFLSLWELGLLGRVPMDMVGLAAAALSVPLN